MLLRVEGAAIRVNQSFPGSIVLVVWAGREEIEQNDVIKLHPFTLQNCEYQNL